MPLEGAGTAATGPPGRLCCLQSSFRVFPFQVPTEGLGPARRALSCGSRSGAPRACRAARPPTFLHALCAGRATKKDLPSTLRSRAFPCRGLAELCFFPRSCSLTPGLARRAAGRSLFPPASQRSCSRCCPPQGRAQQGRPGSSRPWPRTSQGRKAGTVQRGRAKGQNRRESEAGCNKARVRRPIELGRRLTPCVSGESIATTLGGGGGPQATPGH
jgi:hypothetical protein